MTLDLDELERVAKAVQAVTPPEWYAQMDRYQVIGTKPGSTFALDQHPLALCATGHWAGPLAHYIASAQPSRVLALIARARDAERLEKALKEVTKAAYIHMATHPVFRAKAVGDEGSHARRQQLDQIETENALMAAVKEWRDQ